MLTLVLWLTAALLTATLLASLHLLVLPLPDLEHVLCNKQEGVKTLSKEGTSPPLKLLQAIL
jgi:hypothetical protein